MQDRRKRLVDAFYEAGMDHAFVIDRAVAAGADAGEAGGATAAAILEPLMELFSARRRAS